MNAACDHDWRDIDGRWLCIECRAEKPYASDAATAPASERIRGFLRDLSRGYAEADVPDRAEEALEALDELQKLHTEEQRR